MIGALCVGSTRTATYSQEQVRLLTELANATAIALENARLYEQAERAAVLEERQRIAADMHDGLAQTLSYVRLKAGQLAALIAHEFTGQAAQELTLISDAVERAGHEVRQSIVSLRTVPQMDRPLREHLAEVIDDFSRSTPEIPVKMAGADDHAVVLDSPVMAQVLRVVQEALPNARRHASATHILVQWEHQGLDYRVMIQDNG